MKGPVKDECARKMVPVCPVGASMNDKAKQKYGHTVVVHDEWRGKISLIKEDNDQRKYLCVCLCLWILAHHKHLLTYIAVSKK